MQILLHWSFLLRYFLWKIQFISANKNKGFAEITENRVDFRLCSVHELVGWNCETLCTSISTVWQFTNDLKLHTIDRVALWGAALFPPLVYWFCLSLWAVVLWSAASMVDIRWVLVKISPKLLWSHQVNMLLLCFSMSFADMFNCQITADLEILLKISEKPVWHNRL